MFLIFLVLFSALKTITADINISDVSIFPSLPISVLRSDNIVCKQHSDLYVDHLRNYTLWAYEMWDSTAKSSSGVISGNIFQMGHFDQCLTASSPFPTQYCLISFDANIKLNHIDDPLSLNHDPNEFILKRLYAADDHSQQPRNVVQMGWCIPASCTPKDTEKFLNSHINDIDLPLNKYNVTYTAKTSSMVCQTNEESNEFNTADISFCFLSVIIIVVVIIGTSYDIIKENKNIDEKPQKKSFFDKIIVSFSVKKNYRTLAKPEETDPALKILYGIKVFCMLLIILDHRYGTFISSALLNFNFIEKEYRRFLPSFLFHSDVFVDSFFLISGLLVMYGISHQFEKKRVQPGLFILFRYIRLTPVYAFVIFYYATIFGRSGSGPLWKIVAQQDSKDCQTNWWTNLLYINNYVNSDHICMSHSWYLPCDFHYFIVGLGICLLIHKNKKLGLGALMSVIIISVVIPFVITVVYLRPALLNFYPDFLVSPKTHPDFLLTYIKSHTRATPYFIGMFVGYIYFKGKDTPKHICRIKSYAIFIISVLLIIASIGGGSIYYNPYHKYNAVEAGAYAALHRVTFAVGSAGIFYVTSYGHFTVLKNFLSWKPFILLSKLVYCAYLVHMQFQLRAAAKFMNPRRFSYIDIFCLAISDMVLAFITAFILYLGIEIPFSRVFRELFMPPRVVSHHEKRENGGQDNHAFNNTTNDSRL